MSQENPINMIKNIVEKVERDENIKSKLNDWNVVFQFTPNGGTAFFMEINGQNIQIVEGKNDGATTTFICENDDLIQMLKGELDPLKALFSGKLKIEGNMMESQKLNVLLNKIKSSDA